MKIRNILGIALAACSLFGAQASDCQLRVSVGSIEQGENVPKSVESRLQSKLINALAREGIVGSPDNGQIFIIGRFDNSFEEVYNGPSTKYMISTTLTLYVGDSQSKQIYATEAFELKGVGASMERAYNQCLNAISPSDRRFARFVDTARTKIVDYFNSNYKIYLDQARAAMAQRNYDEAMFYATQVPECCVGWDAAQSLTLEIYKQYTDYDSATLLAKAQAAWNSDPNSYGANIAMGYIAQIDPASSSYAAAQSLASKIQKTVRSDYEYETRTKYENEVALRKMKIKAAQAIGEAYAKSRPKVVYNYRWVVPSYRYY